MSAWRSLPWLALGATLWIAGGPAAPAGAAPPAADGGRAVFQEKQCARCHAPAARRGIGPSLEELRRPQGAWELAGRLWNHAPGMFTVLTQEGIEWPVISPEEMADLMAYLRADPARDPEPSLHAGQVILLRKGCLKCHSLRGEGGRVGPDLARPYPGYASAPAWAAAMWKHAPRMAEKALAVGVLYPRFTGDEMRHLVGLLRSAAGSP